MPVSVPGIHTTSPASVLNPDSVISPVLTSNNCHEALRVSFLKEYADTENRAISPDGFVEAVDRRGASSISLHLVSVHVVRKSQTSREISLTEELSQTHRWLPMPPQSPDSAPFCCCRFAGASIGSSKCRRMSLRSGRKNVGSNEAVRLRRQHQKELSQRGTCSTCYVIPARSIYP